MNREQLVELIKNGRTVVVQLTDAEVVNVRRDLKPINHYAVANLYKIIVKDPVFGTIFFSGFSQKLANIDRGDKVSLKVTVTGIGDPSERYPEPILFARPATRRGDAVTVARPTVADDDLMVNV